MLNDSSKSEPGDHSGLIGEIYNQHHTGLERFARNKGCQPDEAADLVNSAFCKLIAWMTRRGPQVVIHRPFWFLATSINRLIFDKHRREKGAKFVSTDDEENYVESSDKGSSVEEVNREMDDQDYFDKFLEPYLQNFSPKELDIIRHLVIEGRKPKEISLILREDYKHVSIDCVKVMGKLRRRLKSALPRSEPEDDDSENDNSEDAETSE